MEKKGGEGIQVRKHMQSSTFFTISSFPLNYTYLMEKKETHTFFSLQVTLKEVGYIYFITAKLCAKVEYFKKAPCNYINCNFLFKNNNVIL